MFRKRFQICSLALGIMVICSSSAYSQIADITLSDTQQFQTVGIGPNESFLVFADSLNGPSVDALNLFIPTPTVTTPSSVTPTVVNVSGQGIFSGATTVFTPANVSGSSFAEGSLIIPVSAVPAQGAPIAEIFFDTTGLSNGDQFIFGFDQSSTFLNGDTVVSTTSQLTFTANVVPEPSSVGILFAMGSLVMLRRKRVF